MKKKVKQGQSRWLIGYHPAQYTSTDEHRLYVWKAFVTKSETVLGSNGQPFNCLSIYIDNVGHYFYGERVFLERSYKSKKSATLKAKRVANYLQWMLDNGSTDEDVKKLVEDVIINKEK